MLQISHKTWADKETAHSKCEAVSDSFNPKWRFGLICLSLLLVQAMQYSTVIILYKAMLVVTVMDELMCVWVRASVCVPFASIYKVFVPSARNIRRRRKGDGSSAFC